MGSIARKLQKALENKQLIITSVNNKAGTNYDINSKPSDIASSIDNISSGGVTIPQVNNVAFNDGIISWNEPNIEELEQYNPSISYLVSVNSTELETTETSLNVADYLIEGSNTISVIVKATFNSDSVNEVVEYSKGVILQDVITTMNATLYKAVIYASAVVIDNKAYIFGGKDNNNMSTIQCYDPISDTCIKMNATLYKAVSGTSAVVIDNKAYIFGGKDNSNSLNTIQCYDPISDTKTTMSATLTQAVSFASAVAIDNKAYIFGGYGNGAYTTIQCYDPISDTCIEMSATLTNKRYEASAVVINNKAYIFGGYYYYAGHNYVNTIECYDPISDTITTMSATLLTRGPSAVAIDNKAYIFGGYDEKGYVNTIQCYDPISDTITTMSATLTQAVSFASAVAIDNKAYIFGGYGNGAYTTIQCYDPISDTCIEMSATLTNKRYEASAVVINNKAYIFGGYYYYAGHNYVNTIECYDPISDTITTMSATLLTRGPSAVAIDNKAYIFGGYDEKGYVNTIQCYDPISDTITTMSATLTQAVMNTSAVAIDNKAYIFGGTPANYSYVNTIQRYE